MARMDVAEGTAPTHRTAQAGHQSPPALAHALVREAIAGHVAAEDWEAVTGRVVLALRQHGLIASAFEWSVRAETVSATLPDPDAVGEFVQPGDEVFRRAVPGPWVRQR